MTARKRRKAGRQPMYGTGWAGRTPFGHGQAQYNPSYDNQQSQTNYQPPAGAPPAYGPNHGENAGYFGGRGQTDVEMQPPPHTYRAGGESFQAPPGPPPNKY